MADRRIYVERFGPIWRAGVEYRDERGDWIGLHRERGMLWEDPILGLYEPFRPARYLHFTRQGALNRARRAHRKNERRCGRIDDREYFAAPTPPEGNGR